MSRRTLPWIALVGALLVAAPASAQQEGPVFRPAPGLHARLVAGCDVDFMPGQDGPHPITTHRLPPCPGSESRSPLCDPNPPHVTEFSATGLPPCRTAQWNAAVCDVEMHAAVEFTYSDVQLPANMYFGRHNLTHDARYARFQIIDDDGFLTLVMVFHDLRQSGVFQSHLRRDASIYREHRQLLLRAAQIGETYYTELLRRTSALTGSDRTTDIERQARLATENLAHWRALREGVEGLRLEPNTTATWVLPQGFLLRWTRLLEEAHPSSPSRRLANYGDVALRERSLLCDPGAASALIGTGLCAYNFLTGDLRPGACDEPDESRVAAMLVARPAFPARRLAGMYIRFAWHPSESYMDISNLLYCRARPGASPLEIDACPGMAYWRRQDLWG